MRPLKKLVELKVEKIAFGGEGIGILADGKTCFVEGALPGETISAEIISEKKNFAKARLLEVSKPSLDRVIPPCPCYDTCGGCQYQHVSYPAELKFKENQVREILSRHAGIDSVLVRPIRWDGSEYGYRNSVTFHVKRSFKKNSLAKKTMAGFIGRDNQTLVPVQSCHLLDTRLAEIFSAEGGSASGGKNKESRATFKLSEEGRIIPDSEEVFFRIRLKNESLLVSSRGFFQNNLAVTELITDQVSGWVEEEAPEVFFDLYAGVGTFSFLCAKKVPKIVCIEESTAGFEALKMNRDERKLVSMETLKGRVERDFPECFGRSGKNKTVIFMDPPRQGIEASLAHFIAQKSEAISVVYLSCDPVTLARDIKIISSGGRYKVVEAVPFDMFPRTAHVEVAVRFTLLTASSVNK